MAQDQAAQIQAVSSEWRAGAAVIVALLTLILIVATIVYVRKTGDLVRVSQNQLNELKEARSASFRPLIHGLGVGYQQPAGSPFQATLRAQNVGRGPAIDVELNDRELFDGDPNISTRTADEVFDLVLTPKQAAMSRQFKLPLLYHDLEDVEWLTVLKVDLDRPGGAPRAIVSQVTTRRRDL